MEKYYYVRGGQTMGPVSPEQFRALGLTSSDQVCPEGSDAWTYIYNIPALMPYVQPIQPNGPARQAPDGAYPPSSNMVWAILVTIFCCLPFGIVGIVQASKVDSLWNAGQYDQARAAARKAGQWSMWGAISAVLLWVIYILVVVVIMGLSFSEISDY